MASWVKYKAIEVTDKDAPWKENITKQIYDMEEIEPLRLSAKSHVSIKVCSWNGNLLGHSLTQFVSFRSRDSSSCIES